MSRRMTSYRIAFMVLVTLLISACAPALPVVATATEVQQPQIMDTPVPPPPDANTTEVGEPASIPTVFPVKTALEASDPATVQLASGGPLLVEFFAFW